MKQRIHFGNGAIGNPHLKVLGVPVEVTKDFPPTRGIMFYEGKFHCGVGHYPIQAFADLLKGMAAYISEPADPQYDGTPLQEQVEKADARIAELEDICEKGLALVQGLLAERTENANDVYQAQLDAQDWQNKYNDVVKTTNLFETNDLITRIQVLTDRNTDLELRNERQANRITAAQKWLSGDLDSIH